MKRITSIITKSLFAILMSGGLLTASAQAQSTQGVGTTIPFAFSAYSQHIAAGTYQIKLLSGPFLLSIRNENTAKSKCSWCVRKKVDHAHRGDA